MSTRKQKCTPLQLNLEVSCVTVKYCSTCSDEPCPISGLNSEGIYIIVEDNPMECVNRHNLSFDDSLDSPQLSPRTPYFFSF